MIIEKKLTHTAQNVSGFETSQFTIEADSHIYQMFSSGVYTDVVKAIIRELSTNAVDAHLDAGTSDVPFDIHLPNLAAPHFSIRDYGTGLSVSQIKGIYSTYLKSTKTGTNTAIGGLGIGSKSPFAYTDNFTITSYHNGHIYIFSTFKDDNGIPSLAQIHEGVSDQPNGLEIQFSVNKKDFTDFHEKAKEVFLWFSSPVNILNGSFELKTWKDRIHYETDDFIFIKSESNKYYHQKVSVLMGQISYPISAGSNSLAQFYASESYESISKFRDNHWDLIIKAPIGSVNFVPSREHLKSTKATNDFLIHVLSEENINKNIAQIKEKIKNDFLKVKRWEIAHFFLRNIPLCIFNFNVPQNIYSHKSTYEKELIELYKNTVDANLPFEFTENNGLHINFSKCDIKNLQIKDAVYSPKKIRAGSKLYDVDTLTTPANLFFFYQTRKNPPGVSVLVSFFKSLTTNNTTRVVFLDPEEPLEEQKQKLALFLDEDIDDLLVYTESNFQKSSVAKTAGGRIPLFYIMRCTKKSYYSDKWLAYSLTKEQIQDRKTEITAVVKIKNRQVLGDLSGFSMETLARVVDTLRDRFDKDIRLVFVTEFSSNHVDPSWVDLLPLLKSFWEPLCEQFKKESHLYTESYRKIERFQVSLQQLVDPLFTFGFPCDTKTQDVSTMINARNSSHSFKTAFSTLDRICFGEDFIENELIRSTDGAKAILQKYPLLLIIDNISNEAAAAKDLIEYIKLKGEK